MNSQQMITPQGIHRVMHEIKRRKLEVLRVVDVTPRMRRITLSGLQLEGFVSLGTDDHVKLIFAQTPEEQAVLETFALGTPGDGPRPAMRDYTPRRHDPIAGELDIDFVLHGDGPAATWAAQATPGQYLHMAGPKGSMIVPDIFDSYLLIGDETALPAIARRVENLPANRAALLVIEIDNPAEQQAFDTAAQVDVIWVVRGEQDMVDVVRRLEMPEGELYAWVATEAGLSRKIRRVLLQEFGLSEALVKTSGYWRVEGSAVD